MEKQTPLFRAVTDYMGTGRARFHMPGHKGEPHGTAWEKDPFESIYRYDITEVDGVDSLYEASGAIDQTERAYANLYGAKKTLLSAGGSTLCIQTMLALAAGGANADALGGFTRNKVITGRTLHVAAVHAMALLGLEPVWVYPQGGLGMGGRIQPEDVETALFANRDACAVYITSPDYYGVISDLAELASVCRRYEVPLLVDNAHGAHLKFEAQSRHPMDLGAAMCCDSLHKTLPVLTGGALLHIGEERFIPEAKRRMAMFGSTSPNYLIMLSVDRCLSLLDNGYREQLRNTTARAQEVEALAAEYGFIPLEGERDHTKIVLSVHNWGISGQAFAKRLRVWGMEPEYVSNAWAVLMVSPDNIGGDYRRLEKFITGWDLPNKGPMQPVTLPRLRPATDLRTAVLSPARVVPVEDAVGCVAASMVCPCPPGIPVAMPGEEISKEAVGILKKCGIQKLGVL